MDVEVGLSEGFEGKQYIKVIDTGNQFEDGEKTGGNWVEGKPGMKTGGEKGGEYERKGR